MKPTLDNIRNNFKNYEHDIQGHKKCLESSVLIPLVEIGGNLYILFQLRSKTLTMQPGEISFPGGKREKSDKDFEMTAVRETCEELGIDTDNIEIITEMDTFVAPFNLIIHPFLGMIKDTSLIKINKAEVDHIFMVPLDYFLNSEPDKFYTRVQVIPDESFPYHLIPGGRDYEFRTGDYDVLLYNYNGYIIWGITAKIIREFVHQYKKMTDS